MNASGCDSSAAPLAKVGGVLEKPPARRTVPTTSSTASGPWTSPPSKPVSKRKKSSSARNRTGNSVPIGTSTSRWKSSRRTISMTSGSGEAWGSRPSSTIGLMISDGSRGPAVTPTKLFVAVDLGDADAAEPALGDRRELDDLVGQLGVAQHRAAGIVDLGRLAEAVVGGGGAAGQRDAADGDGAHHAGEQADEHEAEPARADLGAGDGDGRARRRSPPDRRRAAVRRRSRQRDGAGDLGSFAGRGSPLDRAADGTEAVVHVHVARGRPWPRPRRSRARRP